MAETTWLLKCVRCHRLTTQLDATLRLFNTDRCAYCNGELEAVRRPKAERASSASEERG